MVIRLGLRDTDGYLGISCVLGGDSGRYKQGGRVYEGFLGGGWPQALRHDGTWESACQGWYGDYQLPLYYCSL